MDIRVINRDNALYLRHVLEDLELYIEDVRNGNKDIPDFNVEQALPSTLALKESIEKALGKYHETTD